MFSVVQVNSRQAEALEPMGTKRKFWYTGPHGRRMLFKAEERGTGEDWAEKIACELAHLLGLPHVHYELALESDEKKPGVVCETCAPPPVSLALGNQLMLAVDPSYPAEEGRKYKVRAHTVDAVAEIVSRLKPPTESWGAGMPEGIDGALDVFVGYIMLDAWIANQDRHHENWGALWDGQHRWLAPTFDHGASMARNLSDDERKDRLSTRDKGRQVSHFARRARSAFYADVTAKRPMTTVESWAAFSRLAQEASTMWQAQLRVIDADRVEALLAEVPPDRLSGIGRDFTFRLLNENRERILRGEHT